jgi:drug/metabolite transporter (DMT)-like permease
MSAHAPEDRRALLLATLATVYVVWGSTYLAIRVVVETIPPLLGAGARFLSAGGLLAALLVARDGWARLRVTRSEAAGAVAVSAFTLYAAFSLLFLGETEVPSGVAALLIASVPLWVVVLRLAAGERVSATMLAAIALGFAGVAVVVLPAAGSAGTPVGWALAIVTAAICEAIGSVLAQRVRLAADALAAAALQMLAAGVATVATALAVGEGADVEVAELSAASLVAFAYLVGPGSILGYTAFLWLLQNAPVSTATTYAYVNPVVAVFLGWLVLSEESP